MHVRLKESIPFKMDNCSKSFMCSKCPKGFTTSSHRARHFQIDHEGLVYTCINEECNKTFTRKENRKLHYKLNPECDPDKNVEREIAKIVRQLEGTPYQLNSITDLVTKQPPTTHQQSVTPEPTPGVSSETVYSIYTTQTAGKKVA